MPMLAKLMPQIVAKALKGLLDLSGQNWKTEASVALALICLVAGKLGWVPADWVQTINEIALGGMMLGLGHEAATAKVEAK